MVQISIDHVQAGNILANAVRDVRQGSIIPSHPKAQDIESVMGGSHLTFRYILITNLLAKATNPLAHPLALQAGANIVGAFDSRSLCHSIIVQADRSPDALAGKLGRSNEPYLNKPARYPMLSSDNAVRRGNDQRILETCIDILSGLRDQADAFAALKVAVYFTLQRETHTAEAAQTQGDASLHNSLTSFASELIKKSCEGESCAILAGLAFFLFAKSRALPYEIRIHPVNQSGSSSREILDVDVYLNKSLEFAAEVKDKNFTLQDVDHAATKARAGGLDQFLFICGPQAKGAVNEIGSITTQIAQNGMKVSFVDVGQFFAMNLAFAPHEISSREIWEFIETSIHKSRIKDGTHEHVIVCARRAGLIN